ncbi:MAG: ABC transporter ATP-binding protein [Verrucomicrobia bacterium]|nr:ABC transporter ATP-binding protein [Verrucomicrobiota bacterium]
MLKKLLPYWRPNRGLTVVGIALLAAAAAVELALPWPMKWLVDHIFADRPSSAWLQALLPGFSSGEKMTAVAALCGLNVLLAVGHRWLTAAGQMAIIRVGGLLTLSLRARGYEQFCRLSLSYHDRTRVGDSLYRIAYDTHAGMTLISGALVPLLQGSLVFAGVILILLRMDVALTIVAAAAGPVFWLCIRKFGRQIEEGSRKYHDHESVILSTVQESLSSMRTVQAFTREPDTSLRFRKQATDSFLANLRLVKLQLLFSGTVGVVMAVGTAFAIFFGAQRVLDGTLSVGDVLVFLAYLGMLYQPVNAFSQSASVVRSASAQLARVFEVLDAVPEITDKPGAPSPARVEGRVEFRNVTFGYEPGRPVLKDVSFVAQPGEVIALVGPTGAGKSTLASLLLRFYDPTDGGVLLDGTNLCELRLAWVRQQVSVVLQEALLLSGSVRDNIAYGRPGATLAEIEEAARKAQADEFIRALPDGYETNLAERAVNLSGGQKQRLAIARAFLKNAPILVLDEPTSALDAQTEEALLAALRQLVRGRTTFIIAHRFSTVRLANRILVLRDGRIVEQGPHDELMRGDTLYRQLHASQRGEADTVPAA